MINFYVSPAGNDAATGTSPEAPYATLKKAQEATRQYAGQKPVTVHLCQGTYHIESTWTFTEQDSGTESSPIIYSAYNNENVRLIGGQILTQFPPVTDPQILERLPEKARPHVRQCALDQYNINTIPPLTPRGFSREHNPSHLECYFDHKRLTLARWPNDDFIHIKAPFQLNAEGDEHGGDLGLLEPGFIISEDRPKHWQSQDNIWIHGYWAWDWAPSYEKLATYNPQTGHITTAPPHGLYGIKAGQRIYFLNILEELDQPGEYFIDHQTGILYIWPPNETLDAEIALATLDTPLLTLTNTQHLTFQNLTLEYTRSHGIVIQDGTHNQIVGCTIRNTGNTGVIIKDGTHHKVQCCDIYQTGDTGINISGGNRQALTRANHQVDNCHIHNIAEWVRTYEPGIKISGVGMHLSHNHIHNAPHNAILLTGNEHLIEYNHIHNVCLETGDVGAIYMGRDWTERGIRIQYNYLHDLGGYGMGSMGIYMDDCASGSIILGNIFVRCTRAVFIGGGRNHRVDNNIFVHCEPAIQIDGRGLDKRPVWHNMVYTTMKPRFESMNPLEPPYSIRYPELREVAMYYQAEDGIPPEGNLILRNIAHQSTWTKIHWNTTPKVVAIQNNLTYEDPLFINASQDDYRLNENSPAYEIGIKPIPTDKIGLYADHFRQTP